MRQYYVYILASLSQRLYVGVTNDLLRRVYEHRNVGDGFAARYRVTRLVYFESTGNVLAAIAREKEIKGWLRERKLRLVEAANPDWRDLAEDWFR